MVIHETNVDVEADALTVGGVPCLTQASVVRAIRGVADQLAAVDAKELTVRQFRQLALAFEGLPPGPKTEFRRRRWFRMRRAARIPTG